MSIELIKEIKTTYVPEGFVAFWYLGQEGFLIKLAGKYMLIDSFLLDIPSRLYAPPVSAEFLDFVDYVFCSHSHLDHTDPETLGILPKHNDKALFFVPKPVVAKALEIGVPKDRLTGVSADKSIELDGIKVTPVPAAHEELHIDETGEYCELGYIIEGDGIKLYHAGDSCVYDGLEERLGVLDIAMLPINGRDYYRLKRNCIGNMDITEALNLARNTKSGLLIPMHFDLFPGNIENPAWFVDELWRDFRGQRFKIFALGERYIHCGK